MTDVSVLWKMESSRLKLSLVLNTLHKPLQTHTFSFFLLFCALGGWLLSARPKGSFWSWTSCIRIT